MPKPHTPLTNSTHDALQFKRKAFRPRRVPHSDGIDPMPKPTDFHLALAVLLLVPVQATVAHPAIAANSDFAGLVDIGGGRKMYLECRGTGSPTVVLVSGLKGSAGDWDILQARPSGFCRDFQVYPGLRL